MENQISFFSSFALNDVFFMAEAAYRTLLISVISISIGTFIGSIFGWMLFEGRIIAIILLGSYFRYLQVCASYNSTRSIL